MEALTVFPAPSKPNINTPNSSLRVRYSYRPLSRLYMEDSQCGGEQVAEEPWSSLPYYRSRYPYAIYTSLIASFACHLLQPGWSPLKGVSLYPPGCFLDRLRAFLWIATRYMWSLLTQTYHYCFVAVNRTRRFPPNSLGWVSRIISLVLWPVYSLTESGDILSRSGIMIGAERITITVGTCRFVQTSLHDSMIDLSKYEPWELGE